MLKHYEFVKAEDELAAVLAVFSLTPALYEHYYNDDVTALLQAPHSSPKLLSKFKQHLEQQAGLTVISVELPS